MTVFDQCFAVVVGSEGGYVDNPNDPGGETRWGISKRAYPAVDIRNLTLDGAKAIYQRDYWAKVAADSLPPPLALVAFDAAVNCGVGRSARWLQQAAGVTQDGVVGKATLEAVGKMPLAAVLAECLARRMVFQLELPTAATFGLGWARRLAHLALAAMALEGVPQDVPKPVPAPEPIAPVIIPQSGKIPLAPYVAPVDQINAAEVAKRRVLEDQALVDALNQRPTQ